MLKNRHGLISSAMKFYSLMLNLNLKEGLRFLLESIRKKVINKNGKLEIQDLKKLFKKKSFQKKVHPEKIKEQLVKIIEMFLIKMEIRKEMNKKNKINRIIIKKVHLLADWIKDKIIEIQIKIVDKKEAVAKIDKVLLWVEKAIIKIIREKNLVQIKEDLQAIQELPFQLI